MVRGTVGRRGVGMLPDYFVLNLITWLVSLTNFNFSTLDPQTGRCLLPPMMVMVVVAMFLVRRAAGGRRVASMLVVLFVFGFFRFFSFTFRFY